MDRETFMLVTAVVAILYNAYFGMKFIALTTSVISVYMAFMFRAAVLTIDSVTLGNAVYFLEILPIFSIAQLIAASVWCFQEPPVVCKMCPVYQAALIEKERAEKKNE